MTGAADVELLPCPFCGDVEHLCVEHLEGTIIHPAYRVLCDFCGASTGYTDRDCRTEWNTRACVEANTEALRAEAERLKRELSTRGDYVNDQVIARAERLAEALREIEVLSPLVGVSAARTIARAALHPTAAQETSK